VTTARPLDTSAEVWRKMIDIRRRQTPDERLAIWAENQAAFDDMQEDSMRRRRPEFSDREIFWELIRLRHGEELATKARVYEESLKAKST
jgi:hypothetical protein